MAGKILSILARPAAPCAIRWVGVAEFEFNRTWSAYPGSVKWRNIPISLIDRAMRLHDPSARFQEISPVQFLGTRNLNVFLF